MPSPDENFPHENDRTFHQRCLSRARDEPAETPLAPARHIGTELLTHLVILTADKIIPSEKSSTHSVLLTGDDIIPSVRSSTHLVQLSVIIKRSNLSYYIRSTAITVAESESDFEITTPTPYFTLTDKL